MKSPATLRCTDFLLAALLCGPVLATAPADPARAVRFPDLALDSPAGIASLYQRIERAARQVCRLPRGTVRLRLESELEACRTDAMDRAVLQADIPALRALHLTRAGRSTDTTAFANRR